MKSGALRGHTLIELMVAMVLGTMLTGIVVFIWIQAGSIFSKTTARLDTHMRLRIALDAFERDVSNADRTTEMEFFVDLNGDHHLDSGEVRRESGGEDFRLPANQGTSDPLWPHSGAQLDEFEGDPAAPSTPLPLIAGFAAVTPYVFAPTIFSPAPLTYDLPYAKDKAYFRDQIYLRGHAPVDGTNRTSLIHYRLAQAAAGRPAFLRRRVWFRDSAGEIVRPNPAADDPGTERVGLLVSELVELKLGFLVRESPGPGLGRWFHVAQASSTYASPQDAAVEADEVRYTPASGTSAKGYADALSSQHENQGQFAGKNVCSFVYQGCGRIEEDSRGRVVLRPLDAPPGTDLSTLPSGSGYDSFSFPGVGAGSVVCLFGATDDDAQLGPDGYRVAADYATNDRADPFPSRHFTVASRRDDGALIMRERIEMDWLSRVWLADPVGSASFNVNYRVGFLPAALSIRLACDDPRNGRVVTLERVICLVR